MDLRERSSKYAALGCKYNKQSLRYRMCFAMFSKIALLRAICPPGRPRGFRLLMTAVCNLKLGCVIEVGVANPGVKCRRSGEE